jgi:heme exporter protein A
MITALSVEVLTLQRGERVLLKGFSLAASAGEAVALTGPNGAGKTSLLRAIAGFIAPLAGTIAFQGAAGALDAVEARCADVHLIGHQDGLKPGRSARDELGFAADWTGGDAAGAKRAADVLGLAPLLGLAVRHLSAGQRRRLALARLVTSPRALWLLDEPFAPLDAANRARLGELMAAHLAGGGLIVAAVHDPLPIAARTVELAP